MTELLSGEKTLLRAGGHKVTLYMSIMQPSTLLSALVNDAGIERGDRSIAYDTGTGTGFSTIEAGQTLWIGSTAGGNDKGRVRIKSITGSQASGTIVVAENAIDWGNNDHLTVLYNYELWPVFPLITDAGVFYKDYDVAYTDENEEPPPVCICGPPRCGFLGSVSGEIDFTIEHANHYAIARGATISSFVVTCATASNISTVGNTTTITFDAAGIHWIKVSCTDSNTKSQVRMLPAFVYEAGVTDPYYDFEVEGSFQGSWTSGGWSARFNVFGDADIDEFPDSALIVIWHRAIYGSTEQFIGGWPSAKNVLFAGYLRTESIRWDWEVGTVSFGAESITGLMRRHVMFSICIEANRSPDTWWKYDYLSLTTARAIHHVWRWHSTLFTIADVFLPTGNTLLAWACDDFVRSDLYAMVGTFASQHAIIAHACATKGGQLYIEVDAQVLSTSEKNAMVTVSDITEADRIGEIVLERTEEKQASQANLSGFAYDGSKATPYIAVAPSSVPEDVGGQTLNFERQILSTQAQANELCGRVLARANNTFRDVRVQFHGHYLGALDLMPQEWWTLTIAADDSTRGVVWTDQRLLVRSITATFDAESGVLQASGIYEKEATGPDGVTGDYPVDPPVTPPTPPGPPSWPPLVQHKTGALLAFDGAEGCWYRPPQDTDWTERNDTRTGSDDDDVQGGWDPWWFTKDKQNSSDPEQAILFAIGIGYIDRSIDCGQTWEDRTPIDDPPNSWSDSPAPTVADVTFIQRVDNIHANGQHIFLAEWQNGGGLWRGWILKTADDGLTWEWKTLYRAAQDVPLSDCSIVNVGGITIHGGSHADVGITPDGSYWDFETTGVNDYFEVTWPVSIPSGTTIYCYGQKVSGVTGNFSLYNTPAANPDFFEVLIAPAAWAWRSFPTLATTGIMRMKRKNSDFHDCRWNMDAMYAALEGTSEIRPLWADVDSEDGSVLLLTVWEKVGAVGSLVLQKRETADLSFVQSWGVGSGVSAAEVAAKTHIAHPHMPLGDKALWFVFGRLERMPGDEATVVRHVIKTPDGGTTWANVEDGWATRHCSAFVAGADDGAGNRVFTAIKSPGTTSPGSLFRGTNTLGLISALPFGDNRGVLIDALTVVKRAVGPEILESVACGADGAGTIMIAFTNDPFDTWVDITDSFPGSTVRSLTYL